MRRFYVLLFVVVMAFSAGDVQKEWIVIDWDETVFSEAAFQTEPRHFFENTAFLPEFPGVPVFFKIFDVPEGKAYQLSIENPVFAETSLTPEWKGFRWVGADIVSSARKIKSGNLEKIHFQVVPFKKAGNKIYALKSFELKKMPVLLKSAAVENYNWKTESVLKSGTWKKISISGRGIYKIPYAKLSEWGFSNPANVSVFGSGGIILPEDPGNIRFDDLPQVAVWHGKSNGADCLFFYAPGTTEWNYNKAAGIFTHELNNYATGGFFFLSENVQSPKIVHKAESIVEAPTVQTGYFSGYDVFEEELENILPLGSGRQWMGNKFKNGSAKNIVFNTGQLENGSPVTVRVRGVARSYKTSQMKVSVNQTEVGTLSFSTVNTGSSSETFASDQAKIFQMPASGNEVTVGLKYFSDKINNSVDDNAIAWLDFVEVNFRQKLIAGNEPLFFRDAKSVGPDQICEFSIENVSAETKVFDVTEWNNLTEIPLEINGSRGTFKRPAGELREYVVFNSTGNYTEPVLAGDVENQNLHGMKTPEFLIISHPNFLNQANRLAAFHRDFDAMDVAVVNVNQVFNEFSSGNRDAVGIRNFIKMFYDRNENLKYVLLFGDGSFDNKLIRPGTKNFIPTYQSINSLSPTSSFITDDFFVILDAGESVYNGAVDLGIGRIPASTSSEAEIVVDKILGYYSSESLGEWRNAVCFIGDDEDGGLHLRDSERLAGKVNANYKEFITDKIYLDAFQQETTPAGERYPDVTEAINKRVNDGVLVLNYVGHANERFMADEHVLDVSNVNSWSNKSNLPIFVTATCEFSRYDADDTSIGEYVLFNPNGGGIGLFSTTRLVYADQNFALSNKFYDFVFETDENGVRYRMGDIMRLTKINTINTINKRSFSLLADPALRLTYPAHKVKTNRINGKDASELRDTLGALQKIEIDGNVTDYFGNKLTNFSGEISITVYDKEVTMTTLGNAGETPTEFKVRENIIYKGKANVNAGDFTFSFVIPKDISYVPGEGKIVYYASNGETDAHGAFTNFVIGGSGSQGVADNKGPEIDLYIDNTAFISGGKTGKNPLLLAFLSDENGINTAGTGIGHDITAILDDDYANVLVLNKYYRAAVDDYTSGSIQYQLKNLSVGKHRLKLKAWDVANNSSEKEIEFEVTGDFIISEVFNYPNPVSDNTSFVFTHNQSGEILDVVIEIFDLSGRRIDYLTQSVGSRGTSSNPVRWNFPESQTWMGNGIYPYRITARNREGSFATITGKLIIAR